MKRLQIICGAMLLVASAAQAQTAATSAADDVIRIATDHTDLLLRVANGGRLYQTYYGPRLAHADEIATPPWQVYAASDGSVCTRGWEAYACSGTEDFFEPALSVRHADGNMTTYLRYAGSTTAAIDGGTETVITLKDDVYLVEVKLHYQAYPAHDIIRSWSEISHSEKGAITLINYASSMLYFNEPSYYLTEFSSDWAREVQMSTQKLEFGKKIVDTKLGTRAAMHAQPFFQIGMNAPAAENSGRVLVGTIGWTGNFRFTFEVDNVGNLRVISGINPYASDYQLARGEVFTTPQFIFTLSDEGTSPASRNFHDWARRYCLNDGMGDRLSLLNNWENTGFNFDQEMLGSLMKETKELGVDMFLLDDGWFANKYPRNDDTAGLGDWEANAAKLPGGVAALVKMADEAGVKFGIWIEPEMVNPQSELYERHPDWVIMQPNRQPYYYRHQLVLDMSNPKVQDYVFSVVDRLMSENPGIAFFKWDANSPITNIYSPYQGKNQSQLYVDHVRGLNNVMKRVHEKYPTLPMMLCSGGGARCDYEALKYFTEFWCSDNTDPVERAYIQWGFSQIFPAKAMCAHVTSWNTRASLKFRVDMASMAKLGFDIGLDELSADELSFAKQAVANWTELKPVILDGDQYRLVSPYESAHMAVNYVSTDRSRAVLFAYNLYPRYAEKQHNIKLRGLDPDRRYRVEEINLMPGATSTLAENGCTYSGDYLMKVGLNAFSFAPLTSRVITLTAL
jgi:alpha-galactosidase